MNHYIVMSVKDLFKPKSDEEITNGLNKLTKDSTQALMARLNCIDLIKNTRNYNYVMQVESLKRLRKYKEYIEIIEGNHLLDEDFLEGEILIWRPEFYEICIEDSSDKILFIELIVKKFLAKEIEDFVHFHYKNNTKWWLTRGHSMIYLVFSSSQKLDGR